MRSRLFLALLASLLIHVAFVALPGWGMLHAGLDTGSALPSGSRRNAEGELVVRVKIRSVSNLHLPAVAQPTVVRQLPGIPHAARHPRPLSHPLLTKHEIAKTDAAKNQPHSATSINAAFDVGAIYWPATALDTVAQVGESFTLNDPIPTDQPDVNGTVMLNVYIDEHGHVDQVEILGSSVADAVAQNLKKQFEAATFQPAMRHAQAVKSLKLVDICLGTCPLSSEPITP